MSMQRKDSASSMMSICDDSGVGNAADAAAEAAMLQKKEVQEDMRYYEKIRSAFRYYRKYCYERVNKSEKYLNTLPARHQQMLSKYRNHLGVLRDCIDANQAVIRKIIERNLLGSICASDEDGSAAFMNDRNGIEAAHSNMNGYAMKVESQDMEFVQTTLKLIARDWSSEGEIERDQAYKPIIDAIQQYFDPEQYELNEVKIVVPGAGLGRLVYEIACLGYECEGNEFSFFMLQASHFILNDCTEEQSYTLYPYVHQFVNNLRMADQVSAVRFPDVCPDKNPPKGKILMAAGDFVEVYNVPESYNCVASCFFIDCANNVIDFIETIYKILVPGGIWVNLGPLLYHYSDVAGENSIEPTHENLLHIIETVGFQILRSETGIRTSYAQNPRSIQKSEYESLFWIARKPMNNATVNDNAADSGAAVNGGAIYSNGLNVDRI